MEPIRLQSIHYYIIEFGFVHVVIRSGVICIALTLYKHLEYAWQITQLAWGLKKYPPWCLYTHSYYSASHSDIPACIVLECVLYPTKGCESMRVGPTHVELTFTHTGNLELFLHMSCLTVGKKEQSEETLAGMGEHSNSSHKHHRWKHLFNPLMLWCNRSNHRGPFLIKTFQESSPCWD